jgi:hypothetical protein
MDLLELLSYQFGSLLNPSRIVLMELLSQIPDRMIHQMLNREAERVVSLHAYSPPLKGLKVYTQPELLNIR